MPNDTSREFRVSGRNRRNSEFDMFALFQRNRYCLNKTEFLLHFCCHINDVVEKYSLF